MPEVRLAHSHYVTNAGIAQPWGRAPAYSVDMDAPEPIPGLPAAGLTGPFYKDSHARIADVSDGLSKTAFIGERSSSVSDNTRVGVVPFASVWPKPGLPSSPSSGGDPLGGRGPAQIGPDREAFRAVDALYTTIGLRDPERVARSEAELKALVDSGRLPASASRAIEPAIAQAGRGEWEPALARLARFMEGQHR